MKDVWPFVRDERLALIADLEPLTAEQWEVASLCGDWTVRDVAAHLVDTAKASVPSFLLDMARARFDFDRQNQTGVDRELGADPAETLERMRATVELRKSPPAPRDSRLVEAIVHGEDIRRPLGITRPYLTEAVVDAFKAQAGTSESFGGAKKTLAGLTLAAVDADLKHGDGPRVEGPALSLLLVASGRRGAVDELHGPGLDTLRARLLAR
ncbi:maleylpyruvate isomerase family mycothiol-dependent enzyme [Nocardioides marmoriginsengisoli]|uniref:Maleylpyruvate isomerase family mycothiol-dependent enzyme n=1 Tax=Nocardioides marmoriginsengisoli TaxID=661483 RepID=A0A3N0CD47_9ACTN|nr:maleylpyruvate isomerase family mycothiol-dependent enzyme [Nocardioides marmoriginsengisoli]RNL61365.1 maleylpyruvate isomerase family mycothiol-dependent enzyme [Nocardioides marmoriginsengisoli]